MNKEELKFYIREEWAKFLRTMKYFLLEPYLIGRRWLYGKYNAMLIFWFTIFLFIIMWKKGVLGSNLKWIGLLVFLTFFYMFHKSGKAEKYYEKEYIEGKEIE